MGLVLPVRVVVSGERQGPILRVGLPTAGFAEAVRQDTLWCQPAVRVEITVPGDTSDGDLARVLDRFTALRRQSVSVTVGRGWGRRGEERRGEPEDADAPGVCAPAGGARRSA